MTEEAHRIEQIICQHVHDVRNSLNSLSLEALLLGELSTDPQVDGTVRRMCSELAQLEGMVKAFHFKFAEPSPQALTSCDLLDLWKQEIAPHQTGEHQVTWSPTPEAREIILDAPAMLSVMHEIILGAWSRAPAATLKASVCNTGDGVALELREPIPSRPPKGLEQQRHVVATHGGTLAVEEDEATGERVFTLAFPSD